MSKLLISSGEVYFLINLAKNMAEGICKKCGQYSCDGSCGPCPNCGSMECPGCGDEQNLEEGWMEENL